VVTALAGGQFTVPSVIVALGAEKLFWACLAVWPPAFYLGVDSIATLLNLAWWLIMLVPNLALTWRRLHDAGHAGAWFLILLAPVVGPIFLLVALGRPAAIKGARYDQPISGAQPY
jgi:uncharacterized membrane protein YhaH (DUF805 family)